ncbi:MAG TPA: class I SAM-dependent methyltransferase [Blastocatellia bacterium]|nr:class I SAM-dependent methyltransferase [Blastocatellia bacterium]
MQAFPDQKELAALMSEVGFSDVRYYNLFGGVASLHVGDN